MIVSVSKWGNSIGIRIPAGIVALSGIRDGDKVEVSEDADGSIRIRKTRKGKGDLKAFGVLHKYANVELIQQEKDAFALAMKDKYSKEETSVH